MNIITSYLIGWWTGRRIISVYIMILMAALAAQLYIVVYLSNAVYSLRLARDSLCPTCKHLSYDKFETIASNRFDEFFFGGASACRGEEY